MSIKNRKITLKWYSPSRTETWYEKGIKYTVQQDSQDTVTIDGKIVEFVEHWKVLKIEKI